MWGGCYKKYGEGGVGCEERRYGRGGDLLKGFTLWIVFS